ncbi:hypothetical protein AYO41_00290 [Verrucomicrobia bacterium SCGC AG-212-E04]|nr:hypothetical protein AYO41_00290 [Verrucomicrobia bacterium SCGC AG-212-E04]
MTNEKQWAAAERLRFIERSAFWRGLINRSDLQARFGLSPAQASSDLQRYTELNPGALTYNLKLRRYEGVPAMRPVLHQPQLEDAIQFLLAAPARPGLSPGPAAEGKSEKIAVVQIPQRVASIEAQRAVFQAVLHSRRLRLRYVSFSRRGESWRWIAPHALANDGYRWHTRAWCYESDDYRNFVLGRILQAEWPVAVAGRLPRDADWSEWTTIKLRPRRGLSDAQRRAVQLEYAMPGGHLTLRVRRAMRDATLMHLRLPPADGRKIPPLLELEGTRSKEQGRNS